MINSPELIEGPQDQKIAPKQFTLLNSPEIHERTGSVHFITFGENSYRYNGKIQVDDSKYKIDIEEVPSVVVEYEKSLYMLAKTYYFKNEFFWYKITPEGVEKQDLKTLNDAFYKINFRDSVFDYHYKMFLLLAFDEENIDLSYSLLKSFLSYDPGFVYNYNTDEEFTTFFRYLTFRMTKENKNLPELYEILKKILLDFPVNITDGSISVITESMLKIDFERGQEDILLFKKNVLENRNADEKIQGSREKIVRYIENDILIYKIKNSELFLKFSEMCEKGGYTYDSFYSEVINDKCNVDSGALFYRKPCKELTKMNFKEGNGFYISLRNNFGKDQYMEIGINASCVDNGVMWYDNKYRNTVKRSFTLDETIKIIEGGGIPDSIFYNMENEFRTVNKL